MSATLVLCRDGPDAPLLRTENLRAHLDYIEGILPHILVAGPITGGSMLVFATGDEAQARVWLEADPYARAGLWLEVSYAALRPVAGAWVGGKGW